MLFLLGVGAPASARSGTVDLRDGLVKKLDPTIYFDLDDLKEFADAKKIAGNPPGLGFHVLGRLKRSQAASFVVLYNTLRYDVAVKVENLDYAQNAPTQLAALLPGVQDVAGTTDAEKAALAALKRIVAGSDVVRARAYDDTADSFDKDAKLAQAQTVFGKSGVDATTLVAALRNDADKQFLLDPTATDLYHQALEGIALVDRVLRGDHLHGRLYTFEPTGDDALLTVVFTEKPRQTVVSAADPAPGQPDPNAISVLDHQITVPVDFSSSLLPLPRISVKPSFSLGLLYSGLQDQNVRVDGSATAGYSLHRGAKGDPTIKSVALLHLNVHKSGDFLTGPCVGVTFAGDTDAGYFAGWSFQWGKSDRLSLNVGEEFAKVSRLNGYSFSSTPASSDGVTKSVSRSAFGVSLTYSFDLKRSGGAKDATSKVAGKS